MENSEEKVTSKRSMSKAKQVTIFALSMAVLIPAASYFTSASKPAPVAQEAKAAESGEFQEVMRQAHAGDYQAQRNLAYGYAAQPYPGQEKNSVLACSWYLVVLNSGSPRVDEGDKSNVNLYCGRLDADLLATAKSRASQLLTEIYRR